MAGGFSRFAMETTWSPVTRNRWQAKFDSRDFLECLDLQTCLYNSKDSNNAGRCEVVMMHCAHGSFPRSPDA